MKHFITALVLSVLLLNNTAMAGTNNIMQLAAVTNKVNACAAFGVVGASKLQGTVENKKLLGLLKFAKTTTVAFVNKVNATSVDPTMFKEKYNAIAGGLMLGVGSDANTDVTAGIIMGLYSIAITGRVSELAAANNLSDDQAAAGLFLANDCEAFVTPGI